MKCLCLCKRVLETKMVLDKYTKWRILFYHRFGLTYGKILKAIERDGDCCEVSREGVRLFLKRYLERGSIERKRGSGCPTKITARLKELVDTRMKEDSEMTATQLARMLQ